MQNHYEELRDRVRLLDETLRQNRELEMELARVKKEFSGLREANINRQEYAAKKEEEKQAYLEHRQLVEGTPTTARIGFWEHMKRKGIVSPNSPAYLEEKNRRLDKYGS